MICPTLGKICIVSVSDGDAASRGDGNTNFAAPTREQKTKLYPSYVDGARGKLLTKSSAGSQAAEQHLGSNLWTKLLMKIGRDCAQSPL